MKTLAALTTVAGSDFSGATGSADFSGAELCNTTMPDGSGPNDSC